MLQSKIKEMKVLNVAQPNAHNIIFNGKNIENRSKPSSIRGTIAIYASKTISKQRFENQQGTEVSEEDCSFGCIIGFADLVDCITEDQATGNFRQWFHGPYGYVLTNVVALAKPIEVTPPQGAVIWWTLTGSKLLDCLSQVSETQIKPIESVELDKSMKARPKTASGTRLIPSAALAEIVGPSNINYKTAARKVIDYIEENELAPAGARYINADKKLAKLFGKQRINFDELKDAILNNLK